MEYHMLELLFASQLLNVSIGCRLEGLHYYRCRTKLLLGKAFSGFQITFKITLEIVIWLDPLLFRPDEREGTCRCRGRSRGDGRRPRRGLEDPWLGSSTGAASHLGESRTSPAWDPHVRRSFLATCGLSDHSAPRTWFRRPRRSARTLDCPSKYLTSNWILLDSDHQRSCSVNEQRESETVPPCLLT